MSSLNEPAIPETLEQMLGIDRREFMARLGASLALAGLAGCSRPPQDAIVPYVHSPLGQIDGLPRFFATTLTRAGYAHGVLVESHMGRPTKIEGNPSHPASLGSTDIFAQAAVLQLWDPDRSEAVVHRGVVASWDEFAEALLLMGARFAADGGAGLRILTGPVTSPTLAAQLEALRTQYPRMHWHRHDPGSSAHVSAGHALAFGRPLASRLRLDRARVLLALDADFLSDPAAGVRYARDFSRLRSPELNAGAMNRLYVVESTPSLTGAAADHHLALGSGEIARFARLLARELGVTVDADQSLEPAQARFLKCAAEDLKAHRGAGLIAVGAAQPPWMHALGHALNAALGNAGQTIEYTEPVEAQPNEEGSLAELIEAMRSGTVDTLVVLGGNPAYDTPADLAFAQALARVPHLLHLGLYRDETGMLAEWHLPQAHPLEAWSDARAFDGTASIAQPLIAPLYGGRSVHEVLAMLLGDEVRDGLGLVRRQWRSQIKDDAAWNAALQAGLISSTSLPALTPALTADLAAKTPAPAPVEPGALEVLFRSDPTIGDGQWANNGWLQELPKPLTQLTWGQAALVSPALAAQYALTSGDVVELELQGRSLRVPVWVMPGQAARCITLHLGYGRRAGGRIAADLGIDVYPLRTSGMPWSASGAHLRKTTARESLAGTQHHFRMEGRDLVRAGTLAEFQRDPHFASHGEAAPGPTLYGEYPPGEYAWGMSIDLNACIGCKACTIACQAENNIPVVGREQVLRGREMHWIRVDRYYEGDVNEPRTYSQPVPCMMCEHAPCELVCPVGATVHDSEGLNVQVYNRCVGTRFCSNNCPYKVRRFNFLQYVDESEASLKGQRNPEVTVRQRGVMEKCTYCIQRIEAAHIEADRRGVRIRDGEVVTACQAACPTQAIVFGDIADRNSAVARAKASPRNYSLLSELNTRPRTSYLARLRNPNPALDQPT